MIKKWIIAISVSFMVSAGSLCIAQEKHRELNPAEFAPIKYPFIVSWFYSGKSPSESTTYPSKYLNINTSAKGSVDGWADMGVLPLVQLGLHYAGASLLIRLLLGTSEGIFFDFLILPSFSTTEICAAPR